MGYSKLWKYTLLVIWVCGFGACAIPIPAAAHASVVGSYPASGSTLQAPPESVYVQFNEPIEPAFSSLEVLGPKGEQAVQGSPQLDNKRPDKLTASLKQGLPEGAYTLKWRVVSSDGHPVKGTILFQVGDEPSAAVRTPPNSDTSTAAPGTAALVVRWLWYIGMTLYSGTLLFHLALLPRGSLDIGASRLVQRSRSLLVAGLAGSGISLLITLPLQAFSYEGDFQGLLHGGALWQTLNLTAFGTVWKVQMLLLLLLTAITWTGIKVGHKRKAGTKGLERFLAGAAVICSQALLLSKAFLGHAAGVGPKSLAILADYLHLSASSLWLGGLLSVACLLPLAARENSPAPGMGQPSGLYWETLQRFSTAAAVCVTVLLASGIYGAFLHIPDLNSLWSTSYGRTLLAKIVLLLPMLLLALSGFIRGRRRARRPKATLWAELGLGASVLLLAALLNGQPPASSATLQQPGHLEAAVSGYRMTLDVTPATVGQNQFKVSLTDLQGQPIEDIEQITLQLTSQEMDMGTIEVVLPGAHPEGRGLITMEGNWNVRVHILLKSLDTMDHDFTLKVDPI
ncbi:copper resistance protein CopC [Paenibacillus sanfengchensis]|uniref:copper resistance protein CopC n=1 Tax=Paenibacillus sanfengchensis TaxID=3119819 RepID=UPI002FDFD644